MRTEFLTKREPTTELTRLNAKVGALRKRVNRLNDQLEELRLTVEGQVYRLANRVARLEGVTPAARTQNGT